MRSLHHESSIIGIGTADAIPQFANIKEVTSGDNVLVAAVGGKKLRVISMFLVAAGTVTVYFVDGANAAVAGDATTGIALVANSGFSLPFNPVGWFESASGQSLDINLNGAVGVAGSLTYIEV